MLKCKNLSKAFRIYEKEPGIKGSLKAFFNRKYSINHAVESFDLSLKQGEVIGLLGPNGAGKTTLMKMFTGIIAPTGGSLEILGETPFDRKRVFQKQIALVMGQKSQLWWDIPAMDSFLLLKQYYEIKESDFRDRLDQLTKALDVRKILKIHVRKLSLGERMKMELISSLLHQPKIIFLDEPTIGLDLVAQKNVRNFVRDYQKKNNTTIILTSHYMADVTALCERIVMIHGGQKKFDGTLDKFESLLGTEKVLSVTFDQPQVQSNSFWKELYPIWSENNHTVEIRIPEKKLKDCTVEIFKNFPVVDFHTEKMPIERVMSSLFN